MQNESFRKLTSDEESTAHSEFSRIQADFIHKRSAANDHMSALHAVGMHRDSRSNYLTYLEDQVSEVARSAKSSVKSKVHMAFHDAVLSSLWSWPQGDRNAIRYTLEELFTDGGDRSRPRPMTGSMGGTLALMGTRHPRLAAELVDYLASMHGKAGLDCYARLLESSDPTVFEPSRRNDLAIDHWQLAQIGLLDLGLGDLVVDLKPKIPFDIAQGTPSPMVAAFTPRESAVARFGFRELDHLVEEPRTGGASPQRFATPRQDMVRGLTLLRASFERPDNFGPAPTLAPGSPAWAIRILTPRSIV